MERRTTDTILDALLYLATTKESTRIRNDKRFPFSANRRKLHWTQKPGKQERLKDRKRKRSQEEVCEGKKRSLRGRLPWWPSG